MKRLIEAIAKANEGMDDLWSALPALEKMGFGVSRPGQYGPQVFTLQVAPSTMPQLALTPEQVVAFYDSVKDHKGKMLQSIRKQAMEKFKK
jgi:hypothetical protein